jgi:hypothetical protein
LVKRHHTYIVFVSHSSNDEWIAGVFAEKIKALGGKPWLDKFDLEGGDIVLAKIIKAIDKCKEAVVLVSPTSVGSQWVLFEIGAVKGQHKRVTPILNGVGYDSLTPLKGVKAIALNDFTSYLNQLKLRIRKES